MRSKCITINEYFYFSFFDKAQWFKWKIIFLKENQKFNKKKTWKIYCSVFIEISFIFVHNFFKVNWEKLFLKKGQFSKYSKLEFVWISCFKFSGILFRRDICIFKLFFSIFFFFNFNSCRTFFFKFFSFMFLLRYSLIISFSLIFLIKKNFFFH